MVRKDNQGLWDCQGKISKWENWVGKSFLIDLQFKKSKTIILKIKMSIRKFLPYIISIISLDLLTKLLAYFLLPFDKYVSILGEDLGFWLTYNMSSSGSKAGVATSDFQNPNVALFLAAFFGLTYGILLISTRNYRFKAWHKIGIIIVCVTVYLVILLTVPNLIQTSFDNYFISWFSKIGAIMLVLGFFTIINDYWLKVILISYASCGLGNLLNHFYPPFYTIDFISSSLLNKWYHLGICNVADILADTFILLFAFRLIIIAIQKITNKET